MSKPLVSIIMPSYNVEKYITHSISSIINQTYEDWELFIVDDNSSDNTREIIKDFTERDSRIKSIFRKKNGGKPSIAKNSAYEYISGEYVAFLDSDDLWFPTKLQKQMELMENSEYVLCYSGGILIDENSNEMGKFFPKYGNGNIFKNLLFRYEINNQSVLIKKEVFKKFNENLTIGEDYNLFMNIAVNHKICNIKEALIKYRVHSLSITKNKTKDLSEGTLYTLKELNQKYNIFFKYPLEYLFCWLKAIRFKI